MKTISTLIFALGMLLASLFASAQSKSDKIYDNFANKDGISSFSFSKSMLDAIDLDLDNDDDGTDESNVTGDLNRVRFMSYNPEKGTLSGNDFIKKAIAMLPAEYKEYKDKDNNDNTKIWLLGKGKKYSECHVFVPSEDADSNCFIVSFYGDFTVNDISKLKKGSGNFAE